MAHGYDKGSDKWICTEGTAPTQRNEENDESIQHEMEIKIKFKNVYSVCAHSTLLGKRRYLCENSTFQNNF